ncbi:hypothetical protein DFH27DRAFT_483922 [Peziza echinospora]|nr:hypothetical protein DFH27DRAFT_483922 [Peziza echinospora]
MAPARHHIPLDEFPVLDDTFPEDHSLPAFMVSTTRGFLPRADPTPHLPPEFHPLETLLTRMPIKTHDGTPGLLATLSLGNAIDVEGALPNLVEYVERYQRDLMVMNALYRDYCFVASAYLLEPCHGRWGGGEGDEGTAMYGLGREELPECISVPIAEVARITGFKPFMEYAGSYALYNYTLIDPTKPSTSSNLTLIRAFEHGLDPASSEAGFVLTHIDMVSHSGGLVKGALEVLRGCSEYDRGRTNGGLEGVREALRRVNGVMEGMWKRCRTGEYNGFRTFIFGITSQSMFPNGVLYRGVSPVPMHFRGESGANDSMIPLVDNLLAIPMPTTPLTEILHDFRNYRPGNHREFLEWVDRSSKSVGVREFCCARIKRKSVLGYLRCLDQVREFRWRHWCFTREYILRTSRYHVATGGSPIVTWLPNQLHAVLDLMSSVLEILSEYERCGVLDGKDGRKEEQEEVESIREIVEKQKERLGREVEKYCAERGVSSKSGN